MKDKKEVKDVRPEAQEIPEEDLNEVAGGYLRRVNSGRLPTDDSDKDKNK